MNVLIVEDDPMIARLNARYLARMSDCHLIGQCRDVVSARAMVERERVDLVLLDIYLGRRHGLELAEWLQIHRPDTDVILLTAANEADVVRRAHRLGVRDYLVKPFSIERFIEAITACQRRRRTLARTDRPVDQNTLDALFRTPHPASGPGERLPKGLTKTTLAAVIDAVQAALSADRALSTDIIADHADISRVSARKYLRYLVDKQALGETLSYGAAGRPAFRYALLDAALLRQLAAWACASDTGDMPTKKPL